MTRKYIRKLTLWYPGDTKPERSGVYQISPSALIKHRRGQPYFYCYWDGKQWGMAANKPDVAKMVRGRHNIDQSRPWRGRTEP